VSGVSILAFLHITTMFLAIAMSLGSAILIRVAGRGGNARTIQGTAETAELVGKAIGPVFLLGGVFGLATAIVGGYNLTAPWLLIAYVAFVIGAAIGALGEGRFTTDVARAAAANTEPTTGPALGALLVSTRASVVLWGFVAAVVVLIFDMVVKPFS
jgi:uncharacterized membrane protein